MATDEALDWLNSIAPAVPDAPVPAIEQAVRDAAIEFCEKTLLWTYDLTRISIVADTQEYDLTDPVGTFASIIGIESVRYKQDGEDDDQFVFLKATSFDQEDTLNSGSWRYQEATVPNEYYVSYADSSSNAVIGLKPIPTEASTSGLLVRVALQPDRDSDNFPHFLYQFFYQAIVDGAKAYLFNYDGQPWADRANYSKYRFAFEYAYNNAKKKKITGPTKRPMRLQSTNNNRFV